MTWKNVPGYVFAAPLTLVALIYVGLLVLFKQYTWWGLEGDALVFTTRAEMWNWMARLWRRWAGHTIGQVVVLKRGNLGTLRELKLVRHEQEHVDQCLRLGVFMPILYLINMFVLWVIRYGHPYKDCVFELTARRAAGQEDDS